MSWVPVFFLDLHIATSRLLLSLISHSNQQRRLTLNVTSDGFKNVEQNTCIIILLITESYCSQLKSECVKKNDCITFTFCKEELLTWWNFWFIQTRCTLFLFNKILSNFMYVWITCIPIYQHHVDIPYLQQWSSTKVITSHGDIFIY